MVQRPASAHIASVASLRSLRFILKCPSNILEGGSSMSKRTSLRPAATPVAQLLTIAQVATLLCVHRTKVYDLINHQGLPVMKLGSRSTRINAVKLQQWIEQREQIACPVDKEGGRMAVTKAGMPAHTA